VSHSVALHSDDTYQKLPALLYIAVNSLSCWDFGKQLFKGAKHLKFLSITQWNAEENIIRKDSYTWEDVKNFFLMYLVDKHLHIRFSMCTIEIRNFVKE